MSHTESIALAQAGQPQLFTKFKSRTTKEVESPKSVISDPRIVSPASSASASLERRLSDLKKLPRHDRVYSISDAEDENALPSGANVHAVLTRQLSAKDRDRDHNGLESVSEAPSLPSVPARMGLSSGPSSETSSPRNRIGRSINKDGSKVYVRGSDSEFVTRRLSSAGADSTSSSGPTTLLHPIEPQGVETDKMSFTFSPPKSLAVGVLDRNSWRNAAGIRSLSSKSLEPFTGSSRLRREDGPQATTSSSNSQPWVGSMYDMLVNSINGPLEQIVSGRGKLRSRSEACIKDCSIVQIGSGLAYEDQIEFNKFLVRGSNGEEIRARELKMVFPLGSARAQELRDEFGELSTSL